MGDVGRPTDYKEEYNDLAYKFALLGATDEQLADALNVCKQTLNNWKHEYPEFLYSIKKGKNIADAEIAEALYHRGKGYKHKDVHITSYMGEVTITDITKHYPPDTAAAFIWLKNRQGKNWKDRKEHVVDIENVEEHFSSVAKAIMESDINGIIPAINGKNEANEASQLNTDPSAVLPGSAPVCGEPSGTPISQDTDRTA